MLGPMTLEGDGVGCPGQSHLELGLGVLKTHGLSMAMLDIEGCPALYY